MIEELGLAVVGGVVEVKLAGEVVGLDVPEQGFELGEQVLEDGRGLPVVRGGEAGGLLLL